MRGLLMAVVKWASTGLGWGGGLSGLAVNAETALQTVAHKVLAEKVAGETLFRGVFGAWGLRLRPNAEWKHASL